MRINAAGQQWLRSALPDTPAHLAVSGGRTWPFEPGRVCDVVTTPPGLGWAIVAEARHMGLSLGPAWMRQPDRRRMTFALAQRQLGELALLLPARTSIRLIRPGEACAVPAPCDERGAWVIAPTCDAPSLPEAGRFAVIAQQALRSLILRRRDWAGP